MYISRKENANSQNTMDIIPSWIGGYFSSVKKNSKNYCINCNFTILLETEFEHADIFFIIRYENSVTEMFSHAPVISTLNPFGKHCYKINVPKKFQAEDLIIQTELFSGGANMLYNPWSLPKKEKDFLINKEIMGEDVTIVNSTQRNSTIIKAVEGDNFICIKSFDYTSYLLKVFFAPQVQFLQRFNFLFSGTSISGYLPPNTITKYRATEFSYESDMFYKMKVISGNPRIYGYICKEIRKCFFDKQRLQEISKDLFNINSKNK